MLLRRTILALLLSLTMAFAPAVSMAMGHSCAGKAQTTGQMADDHASAAQVLDAANMGDMQIACSCDMSMPNCETMPQCQTVSGCASQCLGSIGVVTAADYKASLAHDLFAIGPNQTVASLAIAPPVPPPRA